MLSAVVYVLHVLNLHDSTITHSPMTQEVMSVLLTC
jgi:hypothetical protein